MTEYKSVKIRNASQVERLKVMTFISPRKTIAEGNIEDQIKEKLLVGDFFE